MRDNCDGHAGADGRAPKLSQKNYLVNRRLSEMLRKGVNKHLLEKNAAVLDLGCGKKPYQPFFLGMSTMYIGIDIRPGEFVDLIGDGKKLPFRESYFSVCLCLQVLEHVDEPETVIEEIFRVLKSSGLLFLSTHGNWPVHGAPYDYWRWTEHGLKKLLTNFHIEEISRCGGSAASIIQLVELFIPRRSFGKIIIPLLNKLGDLLDNIAWLNEKLPNLTTNYLAVARKTAIV